MAKFYSELNETLTEFVNRQKMFFVATAAAEGRVNLSPKGYDSLRILSPTRLAWVNLTGSGNETAAHLLDRNRMTLMFCSFEGSPMILRIYGSAETIHVDDPDWDESFGSFGELAGARQVFDMQIDSVQTSCGFGVPRFEFTNERDTLLKYAVNQGDDGIRVYWEERNQLSIDGNSTGMPKR